MRQRTDWPGLLDGVPYVRLPRGALTAPFYGIVFSRGGYDTGVQLEARGPDAVTREGLPNLYL